MNKIYFDYCASTPIHPEVMKVLCDVSLRIYANPSSTHDWGREATSLVQAARQKIACLLKVNVEEVIFTSGATESNNLAIFGVVRALKNKIKKQIHVITSQIEHASVYQCFRQLENEGVEVSYLPVDTHGIVNLFELESAIKDNTALISIMHVNNEIGTIQPIEQIAKLIKRKRQDLIFHVDGVQGFGKLSLNLDQIDLYTVSGHKIGGPKGIGLLIVKKKLELLPLFYGGNQEFGLRAGTLNVPSIAALAEAIKIAILQREERKRQLDFLHSILLSNIVKIPYLSINSCQSLAISAPHILNFSFPGIPSALMLSYFTKHGIILSSQSACTAKNKTESRILMAISHNKDIALSSIRISLSEELKVTAIKYLSHLILKMSDFVSSKEKMISLL